MAEAQIGSLVKRLEAATARLEEIARGKAGSGITDASSASTSNSSAGGTEPLVVKEYDNIISGSFKAYLDASNTIGGLVKEQSAMVASALAAQKQLIYIASQSKNPTGDQATLQTLLKPTQSQIEAIVGIREKNRASPWFNHLSTVSEGIPALGWVVITPAPGPYVLEMKDAAQFYANRVIKEYKEKDKSHVEWVNTYITFLTELHAYVKKHHTTGLTWNAKGGDAKSLIGATPSAAPGTTSTAAPASAAASASATATATPSRGLGASLFGELSKGEGVTSGLKKVDKSQMTHKNPELRASSVVKATDLPATTSSVSTKDVKGPPKFELDGNKWCVENQVNNQNLVIEKPELKHTVYIYGCVGSTIMIKGKVNAVVIDNCKKTGVVAENVVSTIDVVNCKSGQLQVTGKTPAIIVDKTDGFQIYLSKDSLDVEIMSAKSSEMNISFQEQDGADYIERAVPEQLKSVIKQGKLVTEIVEHKG